jgi:hypothetical protein
MMHHCYLILQALLERKQSASIFFLRSHAPYINFSLGGIGRHKIKGPSKEAMDVLLFSAS